MTKQVGLAMTIVGGALIACSAVSLNFPELSIWFPFFLLGGIAVGWMGIKKYRWAINP